MRGDGSLPSLESLGKDLLVLPAWRRAISLATPFALVAAFFMLASHRIWIGALACPVILSFITYGSVSHDLVHRTLALPRWLNEPLLSAIELIGFRSGHAYRFTHLHHHAHFPADDDIEARSARMSFVRALLDGLTLQPRLWVFAMRCARRERGWIVGEGIAVGLLLAGAVPSVLLETLGEISCNLFDDVAVDQRTAGVLGEPFAYDLGPVHRLYARLRPATWSRAVMKWRQTLRWRASTRRPSAVSR